jgi:hypothetical protein
MVPGSQKSGDPNLAIKKRKPEKVTIEAERIRKMKRMDLYIKVEIEIDETEKPEKAADEICRVIQKLYVVRSVELSNAVTRE